MTTGIERRRPCTARLRILTQEVSAAMASPSSPWTPLDCRPAQLDPQSLDQLRSLLQRHGMRSIAAALADLAAQDCACSHDRRAALASHRNSGIMQSVAVTLYD